MQGTASVCRLRQAVRFRGIIQQQLVLALRENPGRKNEAKVEGSCQWKPDDM